MQILNEILNILKKKNELHSWYIDEDTDSERRSQANVWKVLLQKTLQQPTW